MRSNLRIGLPLLLAVAGIACGDGSSDSDDDTSAALSSTDQFSFDVASPREARGDLDPLNAYWAMRLAQVAQRRASDGSDSKPATMRALQEIGVKVKVLTPFHAATDAQRLNERRAFTGTDGFYVRTEGAGFVVFRATEADKLNDMIVSSRIAQTDVVIRDTKVGEAHAGFYNGFLAAWKNGLREAIATHQRDLPLYFVGHSLGGALATVAAPHAMIDVGVPVRALYTFASPRVGDGHFASNVVRRIHSGGGHVFRFVSEGDFVTTIPRFEPTVAIDGLIEPYRHLGERDDERALAILVTKDGKLEPKPRARCAENANLAQCDAHWRELPSLFKDRDRLMKVHGAEHYLDAILRAAKASDR